VIVIRLFLFAFFSVLLGASLLNVLPMQHWLLELNRNFGSYYLVIHCILIPVGIWLSIHSARVHEIWLLVSVNILLFIYYAFPLFPLLFHYSVPEGDLSCDRGETVLFLQVESEAAVRESRALIERFRPSILFLVADAGQSHESAIELLAGYQFKEQALGPHGSSLHIASLHRLGPVLLSNLGEDLPGALMVELPGVRVPRAALGLVVGVDPLSDEGLERNIRTMRRSSAALRSLELPALVAVSLRMTPHSKLYRVFKEDSLLRDLFSGKGLVRTWSGRSELIRFHYDQLFVQGSVLHADVSTIPLAEFDHVPILSALRFCR
jgi:hypothetical protein